VLFEALVIDWLKEAPVAAVARRVRMTWDEVALAGPHLVPPPAPAVAAPLTVSALGMHLHAATTVDGRDRKRLERVCRDLLRPPFVHDAVQALPDDRVRVHFKAPWRSGAAHADIRMTYQRKSV
jgi:hypothetical protein